MLHVARVGPHLEQPAFYVQVVVAVKVAQVVSLEMCLAEAGMTASSKSTQEFQ